MNTSLVYHSFAVSKYANKSLTFKIAYHCWEKIPEVFPQFVMMITVNFPDYKLQVYEKIHVQPTNLNHCNEKMAQNQYFHCPCQ